MDRKKKKGLGILAKLTLMCALPIICADVILAVYSINALQTGMKEKVMEGLSMVCQSVSASYDAIDPGEYSVKGYLLYKGDYNITAHEDIIDSYTLGGDTDVTLFYGDVRVATSLIDKSGNRMLWTKASDVVVEHVLKGGKEYSTDSIVINDKNYYAYYKPVMNREGSVVGMVFSGKPSEDVDATIRTKTIGILFISIVILVVAVVVCLFLVKGIAVIVVRVSGMLGSISDGNLRVELTENARKLGAVAQKRTDEIGVMVASMYGLTEKLQSMVGSIKKKTDNLLRSSDSLESVASQTSSTVTGITKGAHTQAEDIESATMQVTTIGSMIEKIVTGVQELDSISMEIKEADNESERIISELSVSNDRTLEAIRKIDASVHSTNESVRKIRDSVKLITSIANETGLLSINANIEAARAGQAGRGFAVVATQISQLADNSNSSAKTIEDIIHQLAENSKASVEIMTEAGEIIIEQQRKLEETKKKFAEVSEKIETSIMETKQIYAQTRECDEARVKMVDVIHNLSAIAEGNTASMQELNETVTLLADASKDLKGMADDLEQDVAFFKI